MSKGIDCGPNFCRERKLPPEACATGSFRTKVSGEARVVVCCPKGKWDKKKERCKVGLKAQTLLRPNSHAKCKKACRRKARQ